MLPSAPPLLLLLLLLLPRAFSSAASIAALAVAAVSARAVMSGSRTQSSAPEYSNCSPCSVGSGAALPVLAISHVLSSMSSSSSVIIHAPDCPLNRKFFEALLPPNLNPIWTDDWNSYHMAWGEVHCGSNTVRTPIGEWWTDARHLLED